jgi:HK97 family phage prohead protease
MVIINNIEKRFLATEIRADLQTRIIKGTAIVFNSLSQDLGGFFEIIKPESVTQELIDKSDIVMLYNHNENQGVLARSKFGKGTLKINITDQGVDFEYRVKNTTLGNEVLESIAAGDLDSCSFAFRIKEETWEKINGKVIRTITAFESLHDFSIVVTPAYEMTTVSTRSLDKLKELNQKELLEFDFENEKNEAEKRNRELEKYYKSLQKNYLNF